MRKIRWGILSTARIGTQKVIPGMQKGKYCDIAAISSRNIEKAEKAARELGIPKAYGSYKELIEDKEIDAIYNPLPNHLHVEWTVNSLKAGKHVLCEKPVTMNYDEAVLLYNEIKKYPGLKVMEAFMYRHHPQIIKTRELIENGLIGELRTVHTMFSYYNVNPDDIRNKSDIGGGGLLDIGCYCISISRYVFNSEPERVCASIEYDPELKIDRMVSCIMEFEKGNAVFTCSTQLTNHQYAVISGTKGKIEIGYPFTPSPDDPAKIVLYKDEGKQEFLFDPCDQYTLQGDSFSQSVINNTDVFTPLSDAIANMKVIDKIFESGKTGDWIDL